MPLDVTLDPADVGLLVIDLQNGFCHPEGARGRAFGADSVAKPREMVPHALGLTERCRAAGIPVWFTRQVHLPGDHGRKRRRIPSHLDRRGVKLELCHQGTWDAELLDEVKQHVVSDDEIIVKHRASAFYNTRLESVLRMSGVQVLVVAGTTTSFCVDSTIRDAYARDFDVVVPAECVADTDDAAHAAVLASTDRFHGVVSTADELMAALVSPPPRPA
ncbi:isochorismatase family cysteine hydrolase [Actinomadura sp. 7K507]|uniref:cysteine hydrolase family protein n=1 Tax=Actinomadura sp. 7K507 TaxID=2530365 RepID=UPI001047AD0E|nr:isochorismatase family cysteine hydrolase [Actinomadura sp. 7K507]TDC85256.1 cysteine hydrolase [Actinomadura sp. 7K507]